MAVYRAFDFASVKDGFLERGLAWAFGLGKQNLDKYVVGELKA